MTGYCERSEQQRLQGERNVKTIEILIVEDEPKLAQTVGDFLRIQNYDVKIVEDGTGALECFREKKQQIDLVLLDLMLPDISGYTVLKEIRKVSEVPVIILSARSAVADQMSGFEKGADDYITKPFNILEVKARIKAIMRRTSKSAATEAKSKTIEVGDLMLDCEGRRVSIAGKEINLTAKEFDVLELLVFNPNKVYSRENLLDLVWGYEYPGDVRTVDVHIRRLREKIEVNPSEPKYVHTKWGVGYYFQH